MSTSEIWKQKFEDARTTLDAVLADESFLSSCEKFSETLFETFSSGGNLFVCGNGGSHCDAMHFAEEWTGRYRDDRRPIGALALGDPSHQTCVGNDFGFEHIFSRQLEGLGRKGDLLVGISTSGNSQNVLLAVEAAKRIGIRTVGLLGKSGGKLKNEVDLAVVVPSNATERIQEVHIKVIHNVIETVESRLFPENYAQS